MLLLFLIESSDPQKYKGMMEKIKLSEVERGLPNGIIAQIRGLNTQGEGILEPLDSFLFATEKGLVIDKWVSEKVSGTKIANDRKLGPLLKRMKKGDTLIITEISRLGRNLMGIMSMLHLCMIKETCVLTVKERYELGNNINSKVLAFAFGLSAEIERDLISQRTKEALAYRKAAGIRLGRKKGDKNTHYKLTGKEKLIQTMLEYGYSKAAICRKLKCNPKTLDDHLRRMHVLHKN